MLCQEIARRLLSMQAKVDAAWECPISREPITSAVLASDGRIYERESLSLWLERCRDRHEPYSSPVTREALRYHVAALSNPDEAILMGVSCLGKSPDVELVPEQNDPLCIALRRSGSARCRHWNTQIGVVTRMMAGWNDDDTVEWWFPVDASGKIFTPETALPQTLSPLADELISWLGIRELVPRESSTHVFTAYFRVQTPKSSSSSYGPFRTLEHSLLDS